MAIVFTKGLVSDRLLNAYNNNVVRFYQDDSDRTALNCVIDVDGNELVIYPGPTGNFFYNLKDIITAIINTNNFEDDLDISTDNYDDWYNRIYKNTDIVFTINLDDNTTVTDTFNCHWLASYTQIEEYKRTSITFNKLKSDVILLHPQFDLNQNKINLYMWKGYPFDITIYTGEGNSNIDIINNKVGFDPISIVSFSRIIRYALTDGELLSYICETGNNDILIQDLLNLSLQVINPDCKQQHYIKWMNRYGGWSYWLFDRGKKSKSIKNIGELNNDFSNVEDTVSPTISMGKTADSNLSLEYTTANENENLILEDLFESNKIYLYVGVPGTASFNDFIEVGIKASSVIVQNIKRDNIKFDFDLELPKLTTRTS